MQQEGSREPERGHAGNHSKPDHDLPARQQMRQILSDIINNNPPPVGTDCQPHHTAALLRAMRS